MDCMDGLRRYQAQIRRFPQDRFFRYELLYLLTLFALVSAIAFFSLTREPSGASQLVLTGAMELFCFLLILGAGLRLQKGGGYRQAGILSLLAVLCLLDPTLQTESLARLQENGYIWGTGWAMLVTVKIYLLVRIWGGRPGRTALFVIAVAALIIAVTPYLFLYTGLNPVVVHLIALWLGAGLAAWVFFRPLLIRWFVDRDYCQSELTRCILKGCWYLMAGLYLYHMLAWMVFFDIPPGFAHLAPVVMAGSFLGRNRAKVWGAGLLAGLLIFSYPPSTAFSALFLGGFFAAQAARIRQESLAIGTVICLYVAGWTFGWEQWPLPAHQFSYMLMTGGVLLVLAWQFQMFYALLPMLLGLINFQTPLSPIRSLGEWNLTIGGGALVLLGWILLQRRRHIFVYLRGSRDSSRSGRSG